MRQATDVAGVCRQIVLKTSSNISGRQYVRCEGWMAIATAHGCVASSRDVRKIEGGWTAIGEIRRISDGALLSQAEGFVGLDETKTWAQRPEYACRAMAQTRAISRACRAAFAHVVVLIDENLSTTPAEEVPEGGFEHAPAPKATRPAVASFQQMREAVDSGQAAEETGANIIEGVPTQLAKKPTKKGGFRYGILFGDTWVNTFDENIFTACSAAKDAGQSIAIEYTESQYGKDAVRIVQ
jgi:hypothetical protein